MSTDIPTISMVTSMAQTLTDKQNYVRDVTLIDSKITNNNKFKYKTV